MDGVYIVVPTYNEAENIKTLIPRIKSLSSDFHIVVVDDSSPDGTADMAQALGQSYGDITVCRRPGKMGIGSALRDGMRTALSFGDCKFVVTMDADFSHDPEDIPRLLEKAEGVDLVQGSRYAKGGEIFGWNWQRKFISITANSLYRCSFGLKQNEVTTSFRVYSRKCAEIVVNHVKADKYEFAVASALTIKDYGLSVYEVPIEFFNRVQGKSKLKIWDIIYSIRFLVSTFIIRLFKNSGFQRFMKFCIVGATGIMVNQGLLWLLTDVFGIYYLYSALVAIESSIVSNFVFNDLWTFQDIRLLAGNVFHRFLKYNLVSLAGVGLNVFILWLLTDIFHMYYLISNLFGIAAAVTWNYLISLKWAWARSVRENRNSTKNEIIPIR